MTPIEQDHINSFFTLSDQFNALKVTYDSIISQKSARDMIQKEYNQAVKAFESNASKPESRAFYQADQKLTDAFNLLEH